jgi:hypothetical protein
MSVFASRSWPRPLRRYGCEPMRSVVRPIALSLIVSAIAVVAAPAFAQTGAPSRAESQAGWRNAWRSPTQTPSGAETASAFAMTTNKGFSATIRLAESTEAERFIREWNESASTKPPTLQATERVTRGQSVMLLVLYAGCSTKATSPTPCDATLDVKTMDPNGNVLMEQFDIPLARDVLAHPDTLQLSPITLQTDFELSDIEGMYRYDVTLRNPERNAVIRLTDTIVLGAQAAAP